tara:strand:+ start:1569 stop:4097 length:2529 start_codon:yes stop_codon:yes gene_type:complete
MAQAASFSVILEAQNNLKAVLNQANGMIRQSTDELKKASAAQTKMGTIVDTVKAKVLSFKGGLLALGAAAAATAKPLFGFAMEGAQLSDQLDFVGQRVGNLNELLERTREATGGMVDDAQIVKGVALMDSFGLELDKLPELYEQATKASLRTGESIDILLDSAVRGIARLSPRIVDNLGIQIELADATQVAADRFGVEAKAVDDTQKKAGMLSLVLKELGTLNRDVDLNRSRVASLKSVETAFVNFKNTMAREWADLFTSTGTKLEQFSQQSTVALRNADAAWANTEKNIRNRVNNISALLDEAGSLNLTSFRQAALQQEEVAAKQELQQRQLARAGSLQAEINTKLINQRVLQLEQGKWIIYDQKQLEAITKRVTFNAELRNKQEVAALEARFAQRRAEEARRSEADRARIKNLSEMTRIAMGESQTQIEIENTQAKIAALEKAGAGLQDEALEKAQQKLIRLDGQLKKEKDRLGVSRKVRKVEVDNTDALKRQIELLERSNKIAAEKDPRRRAALKDEFAFVDLLKEADKFEKKGLDMQFFKAKLLAIERDYKKEIDAIDADEANVRFRIAAAKDNVALLMATTEEKRIQIQLDSELAEINHTITDEEERSLAINAALIDSKIQLRDLEQARMEELMATLGEGVGDAFGRSAGLLQQMDRDLAELNREERFENIISGFQAMSHAIPQATKKFAELGDASLTSGQKVAGGIAAGLGMIGPSVAGFVKGTKEKAAIMGAFEAAMAVATAFTNPAEAVGHGIAAAMFFAMAGVASTIPTTPLEETTGGDDLVTPASGPKEQEAQRIVVNFGPGMILGLPQELGRAISDQINSMAGTGMESTAF